MAIHKKSLSALPSVRELRAFVAIYRTGSVSAAAQLLALTQPAVTVLLRQLEDKLGLKLFDRSSRSLRRTEAAAQAIGYAQRALAELDAMVSGMADFASGACGTVRVCATATVAQTLLPAALHQFLQQHPQVRVMVEEVSPETFVEALLAERADLGVGTLEAPEAALQEEVFLRDPLVLAALPTAGLPSGSTVRWSRLAGLPLVTVKPGYGVRRRIDEAAVAAGVRLRIEHEVSLLTTALAMAAHGLGAALVPASIVPDGSDRRLRVARLTHPGVDRAIAVVYRKGRTLSPAARAFADCVRSSAANPRARPTGAASRA